MLSLSDGSIGSSRRPRFGAGGVFKNPSRRLRDFRPVFIGTSTIAGGCQSNTCLWWFEQHRRDMAEQKKAEQDKQREQSGEIRTSFAHETSQSIDSDARETIENRPKSLN